MQIPTAIAPAKQKTAAPMNPRIASANGTWHDDGAGLSIGDLGSIFSFLQEILKTSALLLEDGSAPRGWPPGPRCGASKHQLKILHETIPAYVLTTLSENYLWIFT